MVDYTHIHHVVHYKIIRKRPYLLLLFLHPCRISNILLWGLVKNLRRTLQQIFWRRISYGSFGHGNSWIKLESFVVEQIIGIIWVFMIPLSAGFGSFTGLRNGLLVHVCWLWWENLLYAGHVNRERNNDLDDEYHGHFVLQHRLFYTAYYLSKVYMAFLESNIGWSKHLWIKKLLMRVVAQM